MNLAPALRHAEQLLRELLQFSSPADQVVSRYFRANHQLGQQDRALVAEAVYAVLRRKRSLEASVGSPAPRALLIAALVRVLGYSVRSLEETLRDKSKELGARARAASDFLPAVQADLPDWLWEALSAQEGEEQAMRIAQSLLGAAPLDLRVNLARTSRDAAIAALAASGIEARPTPYSPAGLRIAGKPAVNRHELFKTGQIEVQDEGSQLLAYLVAPRRGEMVADFCAGAGGKALAMAMLMRSTGRLYAMDVSARRLAAFGPRAARAQVSNIHPMGLDSENDVRIKRLAGKMDRVLVDAPCTGFGTLRRNPDLKWRQGPQAVAELAAKQARILASAARLVKPGGRLVYATCSILREENEAIAEGFAAAHPEFAPLSCQALLADQQMELECGQYLHLRPHEHACDAFFAAAFQRRKADGAETPAAPPPGRRSRRMSKA
jgi:16S rRNA (cytosine967-C5)-methyltransferase